MTGWLELAGSSYSCDCHQLLSQTIPGSADRLGLSAPGNEQLKSVMAQPSNPAMQQLLTFRRTGEHTYARQQRFARRKHFGNLCDPDQLLDVSGLPQPHEQVIDASVRRRHAVDHG